MNLIKSILQLLFKIFAGFIIYLLALKIVRKLVHFPVPAAVGHFLDSNLRRRLQPAEPVIERSGIKSGMHVLEIGCGSGAYTLHVARTVGGNGHVSALDIQPAMLHQLEQKLKRPENQDVQNITLFENSAYELPFDTGIFDVVYMITVLQEIPDRQRVLWEAKRVLKVGGKLAVTEFLPDPDYALAGTTVKLGKQAGLELDAVLGNLWTYTARFRKPAPGSH